jgi:hypothetical protein
MIELTGFGSVLRGIGILYWLLAIGAIALALYKNKTTRTRTIWTIVAVLVFGFLPAKQMIEQYQKNAFAKEAWAYFRHKCDTEAGEKIYKTFTGVRSVLVVKPLPSATDKDNFDQFWYGDPYSASTASGRALYAATRLTLDRRHRSGSGVQKGLDFVEMKNESGNGYTRIYRPVSNNELSVKEKIQRPISKYGVEWEDISTPENRKFWVAGSRFRVIDLEDNSVVAERIGYLIEAGFGSTAGQRRPWLTSRGIGPNGRSCPDAHDATDLWFITSVFKQEGEK